MALLSKASSNELNSPFYLKNKALCESWEDFINDKKGTSEGKYNAWSLLFHGKFTSKLTVEIKLKITSIPNSSLFFKKSKIESTDILISNLNLTLSDFIIKKRSFINSIKSKWDSNFTLVNEEYVASTNLKQHATFLKSIIKKIKKYNLKSIAYNDIEKKLHIKCEKVLDDRFLLDEVLLDI